MFEGLGGVFAAVIVHDTPIYRKNNVHLSTPPLQSIPNLVVPLHTLVELRPRPDGTMEFEYFPMQVGGVWLPTDGCVGVGVASPCRWGGGLVGCTDALNQGCTGGCGCRYGMEHLPCKAHTGVVVGMKRAVGGVGTPQGGRPG